MTKISIIIPCYNQGKHLAAAIGSILGQGYPRCEIIIVNDGSSDDTDRVASTFGAKITYIRKVNYGRSAARNTGVLAARGDYVIFMDADDLLDEGMLQAMAYAAGENPKTDVFVGGWRDLIAGKLDDMPTCLPIPEDVFHGILARNIGVIHCFMVRRDTLANSGLFDVNLSAAEDWDLWIRLAAAHSNFLSVPGAVAIYRRYAESSTADYEHVIRSTKAMLDKNSGIHSNCTVCRTAAKRGWRAHFDAYVVPGALRELRKLLSERKIIRLSARTYELALRYPPLAGILARIFFHACLRRCGWTSTQTTSPR